MDISQTSMMHSGTDVLIAGAGPTGLALALSLTHQGVRVRIVDKSAGPGQTSRAMVVQARTLELYRPLGLADAVVQAGYRLPAMNVRAGGRQRARIGLHDAGRDLTAFPFVLVFPQDRHEALLLERLQALGVTVERHTELLGFDDGDGHVTATLAGPDGGRSTCTARFLAGCDGARSVVRHQLGNRFDGGTYRQVFYVADVALSGLQPPDEGHVDLDGDDFVMVLPYGAHGGWRLIGTVRDERADRAETLGFDDVGQAVIARLGVHVDAVNWFSTYRVHHRVTDHFRHGRVFVLGDAAHVHSPAGGQGMNTGIGDAVNLAWKLAAVVHGRATPALLDSFEHERLAFARMLVDTTDRVFTFATAHGTLADFARSRIAPALIGFAGGLEPVRERVFRLVSQTMANYRDSALSAGRAGHVHGGDRLPWVPGQPVDNHAVLDGTGWQVHVYGTPADGTAGWCERHGVALHRFAWTDAHGDAGLARDAVYLLRPDGYVALADAAGAADALQRYVDDRGLRLCGDRDPQAASGPAGA